MARSTLILGASLALHAALAAGVATMKYRERGEIIAISMADAKKKKAPDAPKPVEPARVTEPEAKAAAPRPASAKAKAAPAEAKPAATPPPAAAPNNAAAALDALPDFGLSLSGGSGPGGLAVPVAAPAAAAQATADPQPRAPAPKPLAPKSADECAEPAVKPKPRGISQPAYTAQAREANVEGKVRIEVTVGPDGAVTSARVLSGLGYGLDEAALAAAKRATFEPGTRCGKPVTATFVIAMRFSL